MTTKTIWKYELEITDSQKLEMPYGAEILSLGLQSGRPHIWALVDPARATDDVHIRAFGTGHLVQSDDSLQHIGTVVVDPFVWHFFRA